MRKGGSRIEEKVKDVDGQIIRGDESRGRWAEYYDGFLNVQWNRRQI